MEGYILVINPGSTSTKVALFKESTCIKAKNLTHSPNEVGRYERVAGQFEFRMEVILNWLNAEGVSLDDLAAVVGRGGILMPMPGGTYKVTQRMIDDLKAAVREEHASNLGAMLARGIADQKGIPSFIVDPVSVDEFDDIARLSGLPELPRRSLIHALNIKAVSRRVVSRLGRELADVNLIVAHLGGGTTIAAVKCGKVIDANHANDGGAFSPERAGSVPVGDLARLCYSGRFSQKEIKRKTVGGAGLVAHLGTNDAREVEKRIEEGDAGAKLVFEAMCCQISKEIAAMAVVLSGKVDRVVLTGGLAYSGRLVDLITQRVSFIAPVEVVPGEDEMLSLAQGAYRVMSGEEEVKIYEDEVYSR